MTEADWFRPSNPIAMTESEWLVSRDPIGMIHAMVFWGWNERKLRLFGCACCRRIMHAFEDERGENAVRVAELYADGSATEDSLRQVGLSWFDVGWLPRGSSLLAAQAVVDGNAYQAATGPAETAALVIGGPDHFKLEPSDRARDEYIAQGTLVRCIFGNPFRPVTLDPNWKTSTVLALAQGVYEERTFDRLPILADALQDAGCDNEEILAHCRGEGPHARGCWVVDLVLGKN